MKILHLETGMNLYGGAKQVQFLIEGLAKIGIENHLCCPAGAEIGKRVTSATVHYTRSAGDLDLRFYRDVKKIIKSVNPDIVHLHSRRGADFLGAIAAKTSDKKCILSRRVDNPENRILAAIKYRLYDSVITISEGIKTVLVKQKVPAKEITCVRSAVDFDLYQHPKSKAEFLKKFCLPDKAFTIGVIAQLISRKGHRYLLEILPELKEKHPDLHILIFGKGPKEQELKEITARKSLQGFVKFVGFDSNIEDWLGNLDLVVHPAEMEGLGVALLQAASAGVPIIASNAGGIPEIVRHNQNGLLFSPGDTQALQEVLIFLINNPSQREAMGAAGRQIARNEFSIDVMVHGNLSVYQKILQLH